MKASQFSWKEKINPKISPKWAEEIDAFENEIILKKQGKIDDKVFAETRLRRGAYGQRYDNAKRHDGLKTQELVFPQTLTKGHDTAWDAPGMHRIKIPYGGMTPEQLEVMAELAEEYSDGIAHVTTRQDFQLHFVHIEDTPNLMRRLAAVGITTREACGNSIRNITGCPYLGVCSDEPFDVSGYANALTFFLLGHPDCQDFGRKFKIAFSGCSGHACGLTNIHDLGAIGMIREIDGTPKRGFAIYVGGGLGSVPQPAKLLSDFIPEEELLPMVQAVARVFGKHGEKKDRGRARVKFLIKDWGIEKFRDAVFEERKILKHDPAWTSYLKDLHQFDESPLKPHTPLDLAAQSADFQHWYKTNVYHQKQAGYKTVTVALPLGDMTANQLRALANICRNYVRSTVRTTVEQNIVIRFVNEGDLPALHQELVAAGLGAAGAGTIVDVVSCPGTDTCKLGISASRGLSRELMTRLAEQATLMEESVKNLRVKVSGCFNSCGQHHIADLGFYGVSRKINGYMVPHFQVVLGGQWENNGGSYGLPVGPIASKHIPDVLTRLTGRYMTDRQNDESFAAFVARIGKPEVKKILEDFTKIPSHEENADFYSDWGDPREYTTGDIGIGECAGAVVSPTEFDLTAAEREVFEAQVLLEKGEAQKAADRAYGAMIKAAQGLVRRSLREIPENNEAIVEEFKTRFYETKLFFDPFAGGKFAQYLFLAQKRAGAVHTQESAHQLIEEASLFVEAAYSCNNRMDQPLVLEGVAP